MKLYRLATEKVHRDSITRRKESISVFLFNLMIRSSQECDIQVHSTRSYQQITPDRLFLSILINHLDRVFKMWLSFKVPISIRVVTIVKSEPFSLRFHVAF